MPLDLFIPEASAFAPAPYSPLMLADRLLTVAQEADRAGFHDTSSRLLSLMFTVLDKGMGPRS
ncbi:MAG TPA: hypothetical protein VE650_01660 [Acetobacteraceae bacterium]|nr:hypothetical protein [Acetobacteraceae bacterium]